jgi:hypothetical protein
MQKLQKKFLDSEERMAEKFWKKTEERRNIKRKLLSCKTRSKTEELQKEYNNKTRAAKRSSRADRRKWTSDLAEKAHRAANENDLKEVYQITRTLSRRKSLEIDL